MFKYRLLKISSLMMSITTNWIFITTEVEILNYPVITLKFIDARIKRCWASLFVTGAVVEIYQVLGMTLLFTAQKLAPINLALKNQSS